MTVSNYSNNDVSEHSDNDSNYDQEIQEMENLIDEIDVSYDMEESTISASFGMLNTDI